MPGKRIFVLDQNEARRELNIYGLRCAGFEVDAMSDLAALRLHLEQQFPQLLLIVVPLLDAELREFVRAHRENAYSCDIPVLTWMERSEGQDGIAALECGVDDYMVDPVAPEDFIARVRALIDRKAAAALRTGSFAGLTFDIECGVLRRGARFVELSPTEQRLLELFLTRPGQVIPRNLLSSWMWGSSANLQSRMVDVSICRLRRTLRKLGCDQLLQTVSRQGYRLSVAY